MFPALFVPPSAQLGILWLAIVLIRDVIESDRPPVDAFHRTFVFPASSFAPFEPSKTPFESPISGPTPPSAPVYPHATRVWPRYPSPHSPVPRGFLLSGQAFGPGTRPPPPTTPPTPHTSRPVPCSPFQRASPKHLQAKTTCTLPTCPAMCIGNFTFTSSGGPNTANHS